jgi:phosphotransferase system HPr (HPr) family protein
MGDGWVEQQFTVARELGLHARPSGLLVTKAAEFESEIEIGRGDEWVSGSSVLSILSLAATRGTAVGVRARGGDAQQAVQAMGRIIEALDD